MGFVLLPRLKSCPDTRPRCAPRVIAMEMNPGPTVIGSVNGKMRARVRPPEYPSFGLSMKWSLASFSKFHPVTARTSPSEISTTNKPMPKKSRITLPNRNEAASSAKPYAAILRGKIFRIHCGYCEGGARNIGASPVQAPRGVPESNPRAAWLQTLTIAPASHTTFVCITSPTLRSASSHYSC